MRWQRDVNERLLRLEPARQPLSRIFVSYLGSDLRIPCRLFTQAFSKSDLATFRSFQTSQKQRSLWLFQDTFNRRLESSRKPFLLPFLEKALSPARPLLFFIQISLLPHGAVFEQSAHFQENLEHVALVQQLLVAEPIERRLLVLCLVYGDA